MMATVTITVREIRCGGCESTIRTALSRVEGARGVHSDRRTGRVTIACDETRADEGRLREVLAGLGFDPVSA
jgi:copper chaperone CopZ